jgi:repressor LexA
MAPGDSVESIDFAEVACPEGCYALKVKGFSMIEDHIMDGDIVVVNPAAAVRDGDVVVALVDGDAATLKRIYREKNGVRLQPANAEMEPIFSTNVLVQGKVESIVRRMY